MPPLTHIEILWQRHSSITSFELVICCSGINANRSGSRRGAKRPFLRHKQLVHVGVNFNMLDEKPDLVR